MASAQIAFVSEDENFKNSAFQRLDTAAKAELFFADSTLKSGDVVAAVERLQRLLDSADDTLVEFGKRTALATRAAALRRILALDAAARAKYVSNAETKAKAAFERERSTYDAASWIRLALRYPLTPTSKRALHLALALAADEADFAALRRALNGLVASSEVEATDVARAALAFASGGRREDLIALRTRFPTLLEQTIVTADGVNSLRDWLARAIDATPRTSSGAVDRDRPAVTLLGQPRSEVYMEAQAFTQNDYDPRRAQQLQPRPPGFCQRIGEATVMAGRLGIYRFLPNSPLASTEPVFQYNQLFGIEDPVIDLNSRSFEFTSDGARIYFAIARSERMSFERSVESGHLLAIDGAGGDGAIAPAWKYDAGSDGAATRGYVFANPPVLYRDLVLISGSRLEDTTECSVFAFERASGKLRWSRFVASASEVASYDIRNQPIPVGRVAPSSVVLADGVAYVCSNLGVVAALDANDGAVEWTFRYNRMSPVDTDEYRTDAIYDDGGYERFPPVVLDERLIVTPEDSRFLYVLARDPSNEGDVILNDPIFKRNRSGLLAVDRERETLVFEARHSFSPASDSMYLEATDFDGALVPTWKTVSFDLDEQLTGRCLLLGDELFVPTSRRLARIDLSQDGLVRSQILPSDELARRSDLQLFGNLSLADAGIFSASPQFVVSIR